MQKYIVEKASRAQMLGGNIHDFAIKKDKLFFLYIPSETGSQARFLSEKMGEASDEILWCFLKKLDPVYKNIFSDLNESYLKILTLMFIYLRTNYGSLEKGGFSFCSHSQGLISFYKDRNEVENFCEKKYKNNVKILNSCYDLYIKEFEDGGEMSDVLKGCVLEISKKAKQKIIDGRIKFFNEKAAETTLDSSIFHKNLYLNTSFVDKLNNDVDFGVQRFLTICFYTFLKNAGIDSQKRLVLDYIIYRYIEDIFDFKYVDLVAKKKNI